MKNYNTKNDGDIARSQRLSAILPWTQGIIILHILLCAAIPNCYTDTMNYSNKVLNLDGLIVLK